MAYNDREHQAAQSIIEDLAAQVEKEKKTVNYYFCNTHMAFASGCHVIPVGSGDDIRKVAERWAQANGYNTVYVYTMDKELLWTYNF